MKFGAFPVGDLLGGYLAHSVKLEKGMMAKGRKITEKDILKLQDSNIATVMAALLEPGDISEDTAAALIARHVAGECVTIADAFTGRVNLYAACDGLAVIDELAVSTLNHVDEAVTFATVNQHAIVEKGQLIATVKIIPLAVEEALVNRITREVKTGLMIIMPFKSRNATLIHTSLNGTTEQRYEKAKKVMTNRLGQFHMTLAGDVKCSHRITDLAEALERAAKEDIDFILVMGASAITDRRDVIPAAIEKSGGEVIHYGMPVDPGNLMLLARLKDKWVLGLPGCSRSPKLNGIDLILARLATGLDLSRDYVMGLGVGGLLSEYPGRPQPRENSKKMTANKSSSQQNISALVLAAGQSKRMGPDNKLLLPYKGQTVLSHVVDEIEKAGISRITVVTGHQRDQVENEIRRHGVAFVHNDLFAEGMSTSVKVGIKSLSAESDAVLIVLGDMPSISAPILQKLMAAYNPVESRSIIIPVHEGKRGNPILWGKDFFDDFEELEGDVGAKILLNRYQDYIHEVEVGSEGIFFDIDTMQAYQKLHQE